MHCPAVIDRWNHAKRRLKVTLPCTIRTATGIGNTGNRLDVLPGTKCMGSLGHHGQ